MADKHPKKAVILISGGLDSATAGAIAKNTGFELYALSFDYGQRHRVELKAAAKVASFLRVTQHKIVSFDMRLIGGSALTDDISVPKPGSVENIGKGVPVTYVPARNTIFLSFALAYAETIGCYDIFIGVNAMDYSGYPDCRPQYIEAFEKMGNLATKAGVDDESGVGLKIHAPLIAMSKAEIIRVGRTLGIDYDITFSCYDPSEAGDPCGKCDSCLLRAKGFREA
jgi:7-cyano-7-deazaguanine synthase